MAHDHAVHDLHIWAMSSTEAALALGDVLAGALVAAVFRHPHPAALATRGLTHEAQLIKSWNRRRVNLNELPVSVKGTLLIGR